ncbi:MAG: hypothetical protein B0D92_07090 [Spirochaeta sp. LUC14_002_19_P3]|nr:MAG: hypothetical protein B0D92_07090 [Spirochaeta sp. LUC14_002_19_P3]
MSPTSCQLLYPAVNVQEVYTRWNTLSRDNLKYGEIVIFKRGIIWNSLLCMDKGGFFDKY